MINWIQITNIRAPSQKEEEEEDSGYVALLTTEETGEPGAEITSAFPASRYCTVCTPY
jgi:hypothetical protein